MGEKERDSRNVSDTRKYQIVQNLKERGEPKELKDELCVCGGRGCSPVVRPLGSSTSCIPLFDTRWIRAILEGPPFISSRRRSVVLSSCRAPIVQRLVPTGSAAASRLPSNGPRQGPAESASLERQWTMGT